MDKSVFPIKKDKKNGINYKNKLLITNDTKENITVQIIPYEWINKFKINLSIGYFDMFNLGMKGNKVELPVQLVHIQSKSKKLIKIETKEAYCEISRIDSYGNKIYGDKNIIRKTGREWVIKDRRIGYGNVKLSNNNGDDSDKEYNSNGEDSDEDCEEDCDEDQECSMNYNMNQSVLPTKSNSKIEFVNESDHYITIYISPKTTFKKVSVGASVGYSGISAGIQLNIADPLDSTIHLSPKETKIHEIPRFIKLNKSKVYCSIFRRGPFDKIIYGDHNIIRKTGTKWIIRNDRCGFDLTPGQLDNLPKLYDDFDILGLEEIE